MTTINNPNEREINYGTGYVDIKSSTIVKLNELFVVHDEDGPVELRVEISADFNTIDKKYQLPVQTVKKEVDKMIGADISFLPELEARGMKFFINRNGCNTFRCYGLNVCAAFP